MATPLSDVYDAFLAKVEADDWMLNEEDRAAVELDWRMLLDAAIAQFRYPRVSLDHDDAVFFSSLGNDEIQVLSSFMKLEWERRCLATWDNIRQLYSDKDFSPGNLLDKITKTVAQTQDECRLALDRYDRAEHYTPTKIFGRLAGTK